MADQKILIYHPDLPHARCTTVFRTTFEKTWKAKGWKQVTAEQAAEIDKKADEFRAKAGSSTGTKTKETSGGSTK